MILVTGATGKLGTAVIENLLKKTPADQVVGLARDADKAAALKQKGVSIRLGDYDDIASLDAAMQGVDKVLLVAGTNEDKRVEQHGNVINAAKKAGVSCIAYTSRTLKDPATLVNKLMLGHFQTEDLVKQSGLKFMIFRNVLYMDTLPQFLGGQVFETGIQVPTGDGVVPFALRSEIGEAIANALLRSDCDDRTYLLTASQAYSMNDVADAQSRLSGKNVKYAPLEKSEFEAQLKARGLPEVVAHRIVGFMTDVKNGQESEVSSELEHLLGRKPASLEAGLKPLFDL